MDDDPLNAPDFDPVAYLNHQFPSGKPPVSTNCTFRSNSFVLCCVCRRHGVGEEGQQTSVAKRVVWTILRVHLLCGGF